MNIRRDKPSLWPYSAGEAGIYIYRYSEGIQKLYPTMRQATAKALSDLCVLVLDRKIAVPGPAFELVQLVKVDAEAFAEESLKQRQEKGTS